MLNLRYEYVEYMTNSNGRTDSSELCPAVLKLRFFQCLLEVQSSQTCDGYYKNTRILLYTPATVSLSLLKRFINSSALPSLYYLTFFIHICRILLSAALPLVFHETNSLRRSQFSLFLFIFYPFLAVFLHFLHTLYSRISLSRPGQWYRFFAAFPISSRQVSG